MYLVLNKLPSAGVSCPLAYVYGTTPLEIHFIQLLSGVLCGIIIVLLSLNIILNTV